MYNKNVMKNQAKGFNEMFKLFTRSNKVNFSQLERIQDDNILDTMVNDYRNFKSLNHGSDSYIWKRWIRSN